ncbi:hypothetical protein U9M48_044743 [Paspalum notatum var. saurae]|uniref:Uncharacterized protein n=1 Tax=Paspalum notatum var. saurae TaxID=547442 RepID=A0AAQ3XJT9_PASNO
MDKLEGTASRETRELERGLTCPRSLPISLYRSRPGDRRRPGEVTSKRCRSSPPPPPERLDRRPAVRLPCARSPVPLHFRPPASLRPLLCSGRPPPCVRSSAPLASPRLAHRSSGNGERGQEPLPHAGLVTRWWRGHGV